LFLDALWAEFEKIKGNKNRLFEFHKKLRNLTFLDPACGCGNFLVITYRELRLLELEVLRASRESGQQVLDVQTLINIDVDQFYGIEIEEFPAQIAQVALWLTDHQMNMKISVEFGAYFARIPLKATPHIVCANALHTDWAAVLPPERCSYVLGNPPFVGSKLMNAGQIEDTKNVFSKIESGGLLDLVAAWYVKAAYYLQINPIINCAFVSTNSITQGEQVAILWPYIFALGVKIHFAHRTFNWSNEARGKAAVHCVIIGFGLKDEPNKIIYEYENIKAESHLVKVSNINPYLVDAPNIIIVNQTNPICSVPQMSKGSQPSDGGNLILTTKEKLEIVNEEPGAERYIRKFLGADEFLNNKERWCLWLESVSPEEIRSMPAVMRRIEKVREVRKRSKYACSIGSDARPSLFERIRQPQTNYIIIPRVSSERRNYLPIGYVSSDVINSDANFSLPNASNFHFGVLNSVFHNSWMRAICGRLKSDYRYSNTIVYNNFPWPEPNGKQRENIEAAAQAVLDARAAHAQASLADLYDPLTMPANLLKAHQALDKAVDAAYGYKGASTDAARVAFLFERYQAITSLLPAVEKTRKMRKQ